MNPKAARLVLRVGLILSLFISVASQAQITTATLSGKVVGPSGAAVPQATVSIKNLATDHSIQTQTDSSGAYDAANLTPGNYEVSVLAAGFPAKVAKVTLAAGAMQTLDLALSGGLSLEDLGFGSAQTQGSVQQQALLNRRSHMLQMHQRLGLLATIPMVAAVVSGGFAGGRSTSSASRDLHAGLGSATAVLYFGSAYYAIFAPKIPGTKAEGPIRLHKALAWIHGPGMILTPILGEMAFAQKSRGERVHGIAQAHGAVAIITASAYGLAILSVALRSGSASSAEHAFLSALHLRRSSAANTAFDQTGDGSGADHFNGSGNGP